MLNLKYLLVAVLLASLGMGSLAQAESFDQNIWFAFTFCLIKEKS